MKKTTLIYGLIGGALIVLIMFVAGYFMGNGREGEWIGYLSMVVSLSTILLGINASKKSSTKGNFSFLDGFRVGLMITLIASALYVLGWMYYSDTYAPDFMEKYVESQIEAREAAGVAEEEISAYKEEMKELKEKFKNPFYKALITFTEIFPVGLLISLIGAWIFMDKKKS